MKINFFSGPMMLKQLKPILNYPEFVKDLKVFKFVDIDCMKKDAVIQGSFVKDFLASSRVVQKDLCEKFKECFNE